MKAVTWVLFALFVAALPINHIVSAAQDDAETIETTLTEWEVRVSGPNFALDSVALEEYPHGEGERLYISSVDSPSFAEISFFDDSDTPEDTIDVMMRDFESTSQVFQVIESGNQDRIYYSLAKFRISADLSGYFYIEVAEDISGNIDLVQSLYAINQDFGEQLSLASGEISIAGNAFLGVTAIDVDAAIDADEAASATPIATPGPVTYEYTWIDSTMEVRPPLTLDYDSQTEDMESVFVSSDTGFAYVGYLKMQSDSPGLAMDKIFDGAPTGSDAPVLLHSDIDGERISALYRIPVDGGLTIMVIEISAAGDGLWQVEALAATESEILAEIQIFQESISINGTRFLDRTSVDEVESILLENQP